MKPRKFYLAVSAKLLEATVRRHDKTLNITSSLLPDDLFPDKALVVPCKLSNKSKIKSCLLLDTRATGIVFIDEKMACHVCHVLQILFFP